MRKRKFIVEKNKTTSKSGYYDVVQEGEEGVLNRVRIRSRLQYYTTEPGYNYCHPWQRAKENAEAIAKWLNQLYGEQEEISEAEESLKEEFKKDLISTINYILVDSPRMEKSSTIAEAGGLAGQWNDKILELRDIFLKLKKNKHKTVSAQKGASNG